MENPNIGEEQMREYITLPNGVEFSKEITRHLSEYMSGTPEEVAKHILSQNQPYPDKLNPGRNIADVSVNELRLDTPIPDIELPSGTLHFGTSEDVMSIIENIVSRNNESKNPERRFMGVITPPRSVHNGPSLNLIYNNTCNDASIFAGDFYNTMRLCYSLATDSKLDDDGMLIKANLGFRLFYVTTQPNTWNPLPTDLVTRNILMVESSKRFMSTNNVKPVMAIVSNSTFANGIGTFLSAFHGAAKTKIDPRKIESYACLPGKVSNLKESLRIK